MKLRASARTFARHKRGSAAIEFAMMAPVLFTILFGTFQLGWAYHCAGSVQFALERASRTLMVDADADQTDVRAIMDGFLDNVANDAFEVSLDQVVINGVTFSRATSTYQHTVDIPFVPPFDLNFTAVQIVPRPEDPNAANVANS